MSYSEVINEFQNSTPTELFERLFYQKANEIIAVEDAEQQLQIATNNLAQTNSDIKHFLLALYKRGVIKEENRKLQVAYIKDNACIWRCEQNLDSNEIICTVEMITNFDFNR